MPADVRVGCVGMATLDTVLVARDVSYQHDAVTLLDEVSVAAGGKGLVAAAAITDLGTASRLLALVGGESDVKRRVPSDVSAGLLGVLDVDSRVWMSVSRAEEVVTWVATGRVRESQQQLEQSTSTLVESVDALYLTAEDLRLVRITAAQSVASGIPLAVNLCRPLLNAIALAEPSLVADLVDAATILLFNEAESQQALAALGGGAWDEVSARRLQEIVITDGAAGGRYAAKPFQYWRSYPAATPRAIRAVVGAGDTFNGAFLAARWARGLSIAESCVLAAESAARCVEKAAAALEWRNSDRRPHRDAERWRSGCG